MRPQSRETLWSYGRAFGTLKKAGGANLPLSEADFKQARECPGSPKFYRPAAARKNLLPVIVLVIGLVALGTSE
jgi:hypothetical protein